MLCSLQQALGQRRQNLLACSLELHTWEEVSGVVVVAEHQVIVESMAW